MFPPPTIALTGTGQALYVIGNVTLSTDVIPHVSIKPLLMSDS